MTKKGYARVSTTGQKTDRQLLQLQEEGCEIIYEEKLSGDRKDRPILNELLNELQEGDEVVVTDLTRITRSTKHLFELVDIFKEKKANLKSLKDTWLDISSDNPYSEFLLTVMGGVVQLERRIIQMRVIEGVEIAKAKGKYNGRPPKFTDKNDKLVHALELFEQGEKTIKQICEITGIKRATLYQKAKERSIVRS